ncbi:MAG: hypothetical protein OEM52_06385 [bacterium]|nr:hypothetical protein [bacterium]
MKRSIWFPISFAAIAAIILWSCTTESVTPYETHKPPSIYSVQFWPDTIQVNDTVTFRCNANDDDGDPITGYRWMAPRGGLLDTSGFEVRWLAQDTGRHQLFVWVSDRWHTNVDTIEVNVLPFGWFNRTPIIDSIDYSNDSCEVLDTLWFDTYARDADNDSLSFYWIASVGKIIDTTDHQTRWVAPVISGAASSLQATLTVYVYDNYHTDSSHVTITVLRHGLMDIPPKIDSVRASQNPVEQNDSLSIVAYSYDPDGDDNLLSFAFSARFGEIRHASGNQCTWIAPPDTGRYYISVAVTDSFHTTRDSVLVRVLPSGTIDYPPIIERVWVTPSQVSVHDTTQLSCIAYDPNGDFLTYQWSTNIGQILGSGPSVRWVAPGITGNYTIRVTVSDRAHQTIGETRVTIIPDSNLLYQSDFSEDEVTGNWQFIGLLAGLGEYSGYNSITWDSVNQAMQVIGRSNYGTFGFQLLDREFGDGTFQVNVLATSYDFGRVAFLPKFLDERNYLLIGLDYFTGRWDVIQTINGTPSYLGGDWVSYYPNQTYNLKCEVNGNNVLVRIDDVDIWSGLISTTFSNPTPIAVGLYGTTTSGPVLFDDLSITVPNP